MPHAGETVPRPKLPHVDDSVEPSVDEHARAAAEGGRLGERDREILLGVAMDSIRYGLETGRPLNPNLDDVPETLQAPGAVFVTLNLQGRLRGCIGSFEACRPLLQDVAQNAFSAGFMDHRFSPVSAGELSELEIHLSLLTPLEPLKAESREDLLRKLKPGVDGLLLEDPPHRSTFLPQVWNSLADPEVFLSELLLKAGLPRSHWSKTISFHRYGVEEF